MIRRELLETYLRDPEKLGSAEDRGVLEALSPLRHGLFQWYEFRPGARLLELNAGWGGLTGLFLQRTGTVTAVTETEEQREFLLERFRGQGDLQVLLKEEFSGGGEPAEEPCSGFDYVVSDGLLERAGEPAEAIRRWMRSLSPEGTLLVTAGNRFGLKYFCGARDPYTGLMYDGMSGYLRGAGKAGRLYSRKEILEAVRGAEVPVCRWYYPVPDARFPQMIFTDAYRKGGNAGERLVDYDYEDAAVTGLEHRIFEQMIDGGALPFLSNSFLLELKREGEPSDICYAVVTGDREREHAMATTVRGDGTVKKRPLFPEGGARLQLLHENLRRLASCGVPVPETCVTEDRYGPVLSMPFIDGEGLSAVLRRLIREDRGRFLQIFDEIWKYIRSSAAADPDHPEVYLDLAPCNCFYLTDGSLMFYDQEFTAEDCPPEFGIFRTLKYWYASVPGADDVLPLREMYARYGIGEEEQSAFEAREQQFLQSVRPPERSASILKLARPDFGAAYQKMRMLTAEAVKYPLTDRSAAPGTGRSGAPEEGKKPYRIGYVPGVFDLLHSGHLRLLERCKERCEYLIVGVLTDELVHHYKGRYPVMSYAERARVLEALSVTDEVVPVDFSNTNQLDAWEQLHFDCHFSGDDHLGHWDDVQKELRKRGSEMEFFSYTQGISSTQIRRSMGK